MKRLFYGFCYLIYRSAKRYIREKELKWIFENSAIDKGAIIGQEASIVNNRDRASIKVGNKTIVRGQLLTFNHGGKIEIGECCFIGERTKIWSAKKITIGNRVLIAHNVNIHDQISHPLDSVERHLDQMHIMEKGFRPSNNLREKEIVIKDDAWIGFNVTILKGVTIGRGAVIGAGSLITHDIPDFAVVAGNPPRILKYTT